MSCLGERLTALVDGELGHEERDRAHAHLAGCAQCRDEVAALRRLKGRLRDLSDSPVADEVGDLPSDDFLTRLRSLPASAGPPASDGVPPGPHAGTPARHSARPLRSSARPARTPPPARPRDNRPAGHAGVLKAQPRRRYLVVGAATLFLGLGTASYAVGGRQEAPSVTPDFDRFAIEHALTSGDAPLTDPLTDPLSRVPVPAASAGP
ncbi:zf-HC2 domain-containing protein [Actinomadura sp. KC345]|uniref:zf-HC2 domain-containing protein n=1 Tax=Actinomadura sp. KC345 TaxID=2530371 RepID=UPI00104D3A0B|nr:zf-HC2 domain-containing protein [Actinomadura sp. KC345]TDC58260.1 zf-HC2 domain-containing protein [Actinomadura sp. KC345]